LAILYRAKRIDNNEWVYGYLIGEDIIVGKVVEWEGKCFKTDFCHKVDPKTVGQYTGFEDMEGNKIYVGDILYRVHKYAAGIMGHVQFKDGCYVLKNNYPILYLYMLASVAKIVGDIHDNPELLEDAII